MDLLHDKIRKLKCPIVLDLGVEPGCMPAHLQGDYVRFCRELMGGLKGVVPAVRLSFDQFALSGQTRELSALLKQAGELGYFVLLDGPSIHSPWATDRTAEAFFREDTAWPCDGLILSPYIGSDAVKPFLPYCKDKGKSVFFAVRSPNKSAAEVQDLMTGSRLVHLAAADMVNRYAETMAGKSGYSGIGVLTAAGNAVTTLRSKYNRMFLLVDGYDYPGGNAKVCSYGFDRFGHGCAVSIGPAIAGAWKAEDAGEDYVQKAVMAAQRIRKNLAGYVTIL